MAQIIHSCIRLMEGKNIPDDEFTTITSTLKKFTSRLPDRDKKIYQDIIEELVTRTPTDPVFNEYLKTLLYFLVRRNIT